MFCVRGIFEGIDFLTPQSGIYFRGKIQHSSIFACILSILTFVISIAAAIYFLIKMLERKSPTAYVYTQHTDDKWDIPFTRGGFQHYLSIGRRTKVEWEYVQVIGTRNTVAKYRERRLSDKEKDHWIYGDCNQGSDKEGIEDLIPDWGYYNNSVCIKKYWSGKEQKIYKEGEPGFVYPNMLGNSIAYGIIIQLCQNDSDPNGIDPRDNCKPIEESREKMKELEYYNFYVTDSFVDVGNYSTPIQKSLSKFSASMNYKQMITQHLNYKLLQVNTHDKLIFDSANIENMLKGLTNICIIKNTKGFYDLSSYSFDSKILNDNYYNYDQAFNRYYLKAKLNSPPVENKANKEVVSLLAKSLAIPKTSIELISGDKNKLKTFSVPLTEEGLRKKIQKNI